MPDTIEVLDRPAVAEARIPTVRLVAPPAKVLNDLGLLALFTGTWEGTGFNLVARPDKQGGQPLFLELNQTFEVLELRTIGSSIPNRGFAQNDVELFGLTYHQRIMDSVTGGALHIEPGIWVTQPSITAPPQSAPPGAQIVARMGSIPHGNAILAEGIAEHFAGPPTLKAGATEYAGSRFPSFNCTPFIIPPLPPGAQPQGIQPAGSPTFGPPAGPGFPQYDLSKSSVPGSSPPVPLARTPLGDFPAVPLPPTLDGLPMQTVVNDPITLLQQVVKRQVAQGHTFRGTVINIASQANVAFTSGTPPAAHDVAVTDGGGGIENLPFLKVNADAALVYSTFWIEEVQHPQRPSFMQLQYAQMVLLNFPALGVNGPDGKPLNFSWPHVSVATLRRTFG